MCALLIVKDCKSHILLYCRFGKKFPMYPLTDGQSDKRHNSARLLKQSFVLPFIGVLEIFSLYVSIRV